MTTWSQVRPAFEGTGIAHVATLLPDGAFARGTVVRRLEGDDEMAVDDRLSTVIRRRTPRG